MFDTLSDSIKASLYERLSTPLLLSFIASWLSFNWELIYYVTTASGAFLYKVNYIKAHYLSINSLLLLPLASSIAISLTFPWLNLVIFYSQETAKGLMRTVKNRILGKTPISAELLAAAELEFDGKLKSISTLLESQNLDLTKSKEENIQLRAQVKELQKISGQLKSNTIKTQQNKKRDQPTPELELSDVEIMFLWALNNKSKKGLNDITLISRTSHFKDIVTSLSYKNAITTSDKSLLSELTLSSIQDSITKHLKKHPTNFNPSNINQNLNLLSELQDFLATLIISDTGIDLLRLHDKPIPASV